MPQAPSSSDLKLCATSDSESLRRLLQCDPDVGHAYVREVGPLIGLSLDGWVPRSPNTSSEVTQILTHENIQLLPES